MTRRRISMLVYLFDIDGTLLLTGGAGTRALNSLFLQRFGVRSAMDGIRPAGKTDPLIVAEMIERALGRPPADGEIEDLLAAYVPLLAAEIAASDRFRVMPGAVEAVRGLAAAGVPVGLATGNVREAARLKLTRIGLWETFAFGGFGDDSPDRAALVAAAIERARRAVAADLPASAFVVVGDTPRDVAAARACGCRAVCVPTGGYEAGDLAACAPDAVLASLRDLPGWHAAQTGG
ncbi:MAG: HAD family hydrolase [Deltaproteobacteria bacterium]|nr:MAG: HAD family hydrolase [Deltaproteobacteria bacterium]